MHKLAVTIDGQIFQIEIEAASAVENERRVRVQDHDIKVVVPQYNTPIEEMDWLIIDGKPYEVLFDPALDWIQSQGQSYRVEIRDLDEPGSRPYSKDGRVKAPIPGQINRIVVEAGQRVEAGDTLLILEAMKMENHIVAPVRGIVSSLYVSAGESVMLNKLLAEISPTEHQ